MIRRALTWVVFWMVCLLGGVGVGILGQHPLILTGLAVAAIVASLLSRKRTVTL